MSYFKKSVSFAGLNLADVKALRNANANPGWGNLSEYTPEIIWNMFATQSEESFKATHGVQVLLFIKLAWGGQNTDENIKRSEKFLELLRGYRTDVNAGEMTIKDAVKAAYDGRFERKPRKARELTPEKLAEMSVEERARLIEALARLTEKQLITSETTAEPEAVVQEAAPKVIKSRKK